MEKTKQKWVGLGDVIVFRTSDAAGDTTCIATDRSRETDGCETHTPGENNGAFFEIKAAHCTFLLLFVVAEVVSCLNLKPYKSFEGTVLVLNTHSSKLNLIKF